MKIRSLLITVVILAVAAALFIFITLRWNHIQSTAVVRSTDDAHVQANVVSLSTRVTDTLKTLNVGDYQYVRAGQVLAQLDDTDYKAELAEAQAAVEGARAALADNQAQKRVQAAKVDMDAADVAQAEAALVQAQTEVDQAAAAAKLTAEERSRQTQLFNEQAATRQTLQKAVSEDDQAQAKLQDAKAALAKASAAIGTSKSALVADRRMLDALSVKDLTYKAEIDAKLASVRDAEVELAYTTITAPTDGQVGQRKVFPGQMVSPGVEILQMVEGSPWVAANFEETQLHDMKLGDPADIHVDAIPGVVFHGKVGEIAPASGAVSSLLPPDNATGNFTKVVQRVPVKIVFDPNQDFHGRLQAGLSAEVEVRTR